MIPEIKNWAQVVVLPTSLWRPRSKIQAISALKAWLDAKKRVIVHSGGQSRRLPAYAPSGKSSDQQKWLIASGDVLVWHNRSLPEIPDVDVLCIGIPESPETASEHGVFFASRQDSTKLQFMLQKPSPAEIAGRSTQSLFFIDVGIWVLSTRHCWL
jgi:hypothetical protein